MNLFIEKGSTMLKQLHHIIQKQINNYCQSRKSNPGPIASQCSALPIDRSIHQTINLNNNRFNHKH